MKFNFKGVTKATWVRIIVLALVLANQVSVSFFNNKLLPFSEDQLNDGVSTGLTILASIWAGWKNNSLTKAAQNADQQMKQEKGDVK